MNQFIVVFVIATFVASVRGGCYGLSSYVPDSDGCAYEGQFISNGESKELLDVCLSCKCDSGSLSCCDVGLKITSYPDDCKVVPDGQCGEKAVQIDDENEDCTGPIAGVGR